MPIYEIETDRGTYEIDADREPTHEEAMQAIQSMGSQSSTPETVAPSISPQQQSVNQFVKSQQAGPISKLGTNLGDLLTNFIVNPVKAVGGALEGFSNIANDQSTNVPIGIRLGQNIVEGGARTVFDLANAIREGAGSLKTNLQNDPLGTIAAASIPGVAALQQVLPNTPNQDEINQFLQNQQIQRQAELVKTQPLVPELISGATNIPLANDLETLIQNAPLGPGALKLTGRGIEKGISGIASAAEKASSRGVLRQPLTAATTEALGITPIEGSQNIVPVLKSSILEANGGKIPTGLAPKELIQSAADFKINQYIDGLKLAEQQGLRHSSQSLVDAMQARLQQLHPTFNQTQYDAIINSIKGEHPTLFSQDFISPTSGQKAAAQINREVNSKNPNRVPKTSAELNAETALSQELSRQGSEMYQASTGTYGTPNQDYGVLVQAREGLTGELGKAQRADAGRTPGGEQLPTTLTGLVSKGVRRVGGRVLIPTNAEDVANSLNRTLKEGASRPSATAIDPVQQQNIINQYTPSGVAGLSLDAQLKNIINNLPKEFRGVNERSIAEAILRSQEAP